MFYLSEANIQENINKCKAAIRNRKWEDLCRLVRAIVAKCWRALEVGETAVRRASDHSYKTTLSNAVKRLEKGNVGICRHLIHSLKKSAS